VLDVAGALGGRVQEGWCPHLAMLLPGRADVAPALASFYGLGLSRNGWIFHRSLPGRGDTDRAALTAAGLDAASLEADGRLVFAELAPEVDPRTWAQPYVSILEQALARGFDAAWFSRFPIGPREEEFNLSLDFDRAWDEAFHGHPAVSLCLYILGDVDEDTRRRRLDALAPFHDGVLTPAPDGGTELVDTRQ
jgi:hypothetical protein